jgi:RNA polymerase sigma-70 factor (ECF subfamily)
MTQEAFVSLLKSLQERLFRTAYRMLHSEEDAKDVLQDVFMKLWSRREDLEKCKNVEAWCLTVTRNTVLDKIKHKKYRASDVLSTVNENSETLAVSGTSLDTKDIADKTRAIINQLPEKQRSLIHLRDIEGLTYDMIADVMEMSISKVKIGLYRARKSIREKINKMISYGPR